MTAFSPTMNLDRTWLRYLSHGLRPEGLHPDITVTIERPSSGHGSTGHRVGQYDCYAPLGDVCHHGSILRFSSPEQDAVYIVGEYDMYADLWNASWPD